MRQLLLYWWLELLYPLMKGAAVFAVAECRLLDDATHAVMMRCYRPRAAMTKGNRAILIT